LYCMKNIDNTFVHHEILTTKTLTGRHMLDKLSS
jgi:hypothetical protein